jgi:hypothetical protein
MGVEREQPNGVVSGGGNRHPQSPMPKKSLHPLLFATLSAIHLLLVIP